MKIAIPHTYKLLIDSKTVDIKFQFNKKNKYEEIKVNLAFEPVASFNRKKLGATLTSAKKTSKNINLKLAHFNDSIENQNTHEF